MVSARLFGDQIVDLLCYYITHGNKVAILFNGGHVNSWNYDKPCSDYMNFRIAEKEKLIIEKYCHTKSEYKN